MRQKAHITLFENSTAGGPPRVFNDQIVEVSHEPDTVVSSVDGHLSKGSHPSTIFWQGGTAKQLSNVTDVAIAFSNGESFGGALNTTYGIPRDVTDGVIFFLLRA